ncbi:MAG: S41 family peptidase [Xanthomonadales bacterium]|jgi:carboxyl-terminal processing protease|nr:S41 family peptidase [Xanthomonadales bacterium]
MNRIHIAIPITLGLVFSMQALAQDSAEVTAAAEQDQVQLTLDDLRTFSDVFNQLRRNFVEPVDDHTLLDAAIRGMLATLDPHSAYLSPQEYQALNDSSHGRYIGIGVRLMTDERSIVIEDVFPGSPAEQAGLVPGDAIIAVDENPVSDGPAQESIERLGGEPGTEFELTVRGADGKERRHRLSREYVMTSTHEFRWLENDWGYFRMTQFYSESAIQLHEAIDSILAEGGEFRGVVIDLRNNPGGILQPAVDLADGFLDGGLIVTTSGRAGVMEMSFAASEGQWLPGVPLVLLVDRGSASASEVLAGALQEHGRALVVGERTFGKGSVQSVLPLRNGGGIKLTTAMYFTPSGRSIQARGIVPDVETSGVHAGGEADERIRESDLDRHLDEMGPALTEDGLPRKLQVEFDLDEILAVLENAGLIAGPGED